MPFLIWKDHLCGGRDCAAALVLVEQTACESSRARRTENGGRPQQSAMHVTAVSRRCLGRWLAQTQPLGPSGADPAADPSTRNLQVFLHYQPRIVLAPSTGPLQFARARHDPVRPPPHFVCLLIAGPLQSSIEAKASSGLLHRLRMPDTADSDGALSDRGWRQEQRQASQWREATLLSARQQPRCRTVPSRRSVWVKRGGVSIAGLLHHGAGPAMSRQAQLLTSY